MVYVDVEYRVQKGHKFHAFILASAMQDKLYKSVIVIVIVNVGGYFVNFTMIVMALAFVQWPFNAVVLEFGSILLNLAATSNALILYRTRSGFLAFLNLKKNKFSIK